LEKRVYDRWHERHIQRWKAFAGYVIYSVIATAVATYTRFNVEWFYDYWVLGNVMGLVSGFMYLASRPWASEALETSIFVEVYGASKSLELISDVDEKDEDWNFHSKKASKKLEKAISRIGSLAYKFEQLNSTLGNNFVEPLGNLEKNLETRILPRLSEKKDVHQMIGVLRGLAQIFGEDTHPISLEEIVARNKSLERFEAIEIKRQPSRISVTLSRESVKLSLSMVLGLTIIFIGAFGHSLWVGYSLSESLSNLGNFLEFLGVGIAIGLGIYEIRKRK
jgi:hypothetical protein